MHFVLDQNFPIQLVDLDWPPGITVTPLRVIDPALTSDHDDWEIFRALHRRGDVDGFISNDAAILQLPREMAMLMYTKLTLVVTQDCGHDALGATGLIMLYLPQIAKRTTDPTPRIYMLKRSGLPLTKIGVIIGDLAARENMTPGELLDREREVIRNTP